MSDYAEEAHRIVDAAIENACKRLAEEPSLQGKESLEYVDVSANEPKDMSHLDNLGKIDSKTFAHIPNITWMDIGDFTVDSGLNKIEQFIQVGNCYSNYTLWYMTVIRMQGVKQQPPNWLCL